MRKKDSVATVNNIHSVKFKNIELKIGEFKPEYAGKMNFYINAVNNILKTDKDNDTIGLILCKGRIN